MLQGIDVNQRIEFISSSDKTEPKTKFYFKPLSGSDMFNIRDNKDGFILTTLDMSITEIKNLPKGMEKIDYLKTLRTKELNELFEKFNEINNVSDDEEKN